LKSIFYPGFSSDGRSPRTRCKAGNINGSTAALSMIQRS